MGGRTSYEKPPEEEEKQPENLKGMQCGLKKKKQNPLSRLKKPLVNSKA